jgi:hypothetical protein
VNNSWLAVALALPAAVIALLDWRKVLLLLGLVAGFFLATPVLAEREQAQIRSMPDSVPTPAAMVAPGAAVQR